MFRDSVMVFFVGGRLPSSTGAEGDGGGSSWSIDWMLNGWLTGLFPHHVPGARRIVPCTNEGRCASRPLQRDVDEKIATVKTTEEVTCTFLFGVESVATNKTKHPEVRNP